MPQRTVSLILGILGILSVAALLLLGADARLHARSGARWKRRLVGAGLALLALLGFAGTGSRAAGPDPDPALDDARAGADSVGPDAAASLAARLFDLDADGEEDGEEADAKDARIRALVGAEAWKRIAATWKETGEIVSGRRGAYPFDRAGKARLLAALDAVPSDLAALRKEALLTEGEAAFLEKEAAELRMGIERFRTEDMRNATCYRPAPLPRAGAASLDYLADRLAILETLAAQERVHPRVTRRVLAGVERHLARLADAQVLAQLDEEGRDGAAKTRDAIHALLTRIRESSGSALDKHPSWLAFLEKWYEASDLVGRDRPLKHPFKKADLAAILERLDGALPHLDALEREGLLSEGEAGLLKREYIQLFTAVRGFPCADVPMPTCYSPTPTPVDPPPPPNPIWAAMDRIRDRLPLLEDMAAQERLRPAVLEKVLGAFVRQLAVLEDPKNFDALPEDRRPEVGTFRDRIRSLLKAVETKGE